MLHLIKEQKIIIFLLLIGCFLRLYKLNEFPRPINQDELVNGHNGYMIEKFGKDDWSIPYPFQLKGLGTMDFRPALYAYASIPIFYTFGYSVFTIRLFSALLGCLTLLILFFYLKDKVQKTTLYFAMLVLALSPWHIFYSRQSHEGTSQIPFFTILIIYLTDRLCSSRHKIKYLALLGIAIGLGLNTYQSFRVQYAFYFLLIPILYFYIDKMELKLKRLRNILFFYIPLLICSFPQLYCLIFSSNNYFNKFSNVVIPFHFSWDYFWLIKKNILDHFSPGFLFRKEFSINNLSIMRELWILLPLYYGGIMIVLSRIRKLHFFLLLPICLLTILPSALTHDSPHALRASGMLVFTPLFIAFFTDWLSQQTEKIFNYFSAIFFSVLSAFLILVFLFYLKEFNHRDDMQDPSKSYMEYRVANKIRGIKDKFDKLYFMKRSDFYYYYILYTEDLKNQTLNDKNMDESPDFIEGTHFGKVFFVDSLSINMKYEKERIFFFSKHKKWLHHFSQVLPPEIIGKDTVYYLSNRME